MHDIWHVLGRDCPCITTVWFVFPIKPNVPGLDSSNQLGLALTIGVPIEPLNRPCR